MQSYDLIPAFTDPVAESQNVFRILLKALSEPGQIHELSQTIQLVQLNQASYAIALTLLDNSTTVWLSPALADTKIKQNLAFHCGCKFVAEPGQAMFAFITAADIEVFSKLATGTDRDPEFSCTAIVQINELNTGVQRIWAGPGIKDHKKVALDIDQKFWSIRAQKNEFPRGIDIFFIAKNQVLGLPRSTRIQAVVEE